MTTHDAAQANGKVSLSAKREGLQLAFVEVGRIWWDRRFREDFGDLEGLADSIREKGILQPLTVTPDFELLAGERRLTAAKMVGLTHVPALLRKKEDVVDAREIELIENAFRKNPTWQEECALVREIDTLYRNKGEAWNVRKTAQLLDKGLGSVSRYLQMGRALEVMPELGNYDTAAEAFKVLKNFEERAVVDELASRQMGRLSETALDKGIAAMLHLAEHNYNIGDTFKGLSELRTNGVVHFIECDPPYGINLTEQKASKDSAGSNVHTYNEIPEEQYEKFLKRLTKELFREANEHCWMVFWFGPTWQHQVLTCLTKAGWWVDAIPAIWVKQHGQTLQPEIYLARTYEPFYVWRKGEPILTKRGQSNVFQFPGVSSNLKYHPTQRPVELIETLLETFGLPGQVVLC